jgi:hypothetical protein
VTLWLLVLVLLVLLMLLMLLLLLMTMVMMMLAGWLHWREQHHAAAVRPASPVMLLCNNSHVLPHSVCHSYSCCCCNKARLTVCHHHREVLCAWEVHVNACCLCAALLRTWMGVRAVDRMSLLHKSAQSSSSSNSSSSRRVTREQLRCNKHQA